MYKNYYLDFFFFLFFNLKQNKKKKFLLNNDIFHMNYEEDMNIRQVQQKYKLKKI